MDKIKKTKFRKDDKVCLGDGKTFEIRDKHNFRVRLDLYVAKSKHGFSYLMCDNVDFETCPICLEDVKRRKMISHHIIPKRARTKNLLLEDLRIKICPECDEKIHVENKYANATKKMYEVLCDVTGGECDNIKAVKEIRKLLPHLDEWFVSKTGEYGGEKT